MIQRFLFNILQSGLEGIRQQPQILEDLFVQNYDLQVTEVAAIKKLYETKAPTVIHGMARTDSTFPLFAIVLAQEGESQMYLGDDAGSVLDEGPDFAADLLSSIWDHTYNILCYAEHPDWCQYNYEVAKLILIASAPLLVQEGIHNIRLSGQDVQLDQRLAPEHLFLRQLTFRCNHEFIRMNRAAALQKFIRVAGIHIDQSGSPSSVGDVKTLVTVEGEG